MRITSAHFAAITAYSMWGLFPIYWKFFPEVGAWDLFAHRLIWSFVTLILFLIWKKRMKSVLEIWNSARNRYLLMLSALLISSNWLLYIYAISIGKILETSLGYFLNPLLNVFLGWIILKEKIRFSQWPAIVMGGIAVTLLAFQSDLTSFPWIALLLSLTFASYGLIRKTAHVSSLEGLAYETFFIMIPASCMWFFLPQGQAPLFNLLPSWKLILLSMAGVITCTPLVLFAYGAKRLPFSTLGFIGYLSPLLKFICGWLIFQEPLSSERLHAFMIIWLALAWYSMEAFIHHRKTSPS